MPPLDGEELPAAGRYPGEILRPVRQQREEDIQIVLELALQGPNQGAQDGQGVRCGGIRKEEQEKAALIQHKGQTAIARCRLVGGQIHQVLADMSGRKTGCGAVRLVDFLDVSQDDRDSSCHRQIQFLQRALGLPAEGLICQIGLHELGEAVPRRSPGRFELPGLLIQRLPGLLEAGLYLGLRHGGLQQVVPHPQGHHLLEGLELLQAGDDDDIGLQPRVPHGFDQLLSAHAGHQEVGDQDVRTAFLDSP